MDLILEYSFHWDKPHTPIVFHSILSILDHRLYQMTIVTKHTIEIGYFEGSKFDY